MLTVVGIRHKRGLKYPIKDTQKMYYFVCPIRDIQIGDFVILEYKMHNSGNRENFFGIGRVDFIEVGNNEVLLKKYHPTSYVLARVDRDIDFEKRCSTAKRMRYKLKGKYEQMERMKAQKKKTQDKDK